MTEATNEANLQQALEAWNAGHLDAWLVQPGAVQPLG